MRRITGVAAAVGILFTTAACAAEPGEAMAWGSDQASLTMTGDGATIQFLAPGGCYGSYGTIGRPVPAGSFALSGTFTQLMGAAPGRVQYPAEFTGSVTGNTMTLTVRVPSLPLTLGPYQLAAGVTKSWPACLYP